MNKAVKVIATFLLSFLLAIIIMNRSEGMVLASSVPVPEFHFVINSQDRPTGSEFEMKTPEMIIHVSSDSMTSAATVEWVSSVPGVVSLENTTFGSNFIKLVRNGPGYSTITAIIRQGGNSYSISCLVKVDLAFDAQNMGLITATTTKEKILILNSVGDQKQSILKFVDYTPEGEPVAVSGAAFNVNIVDWDSSNDGVATVSSTGRITAIGAGSTTITCTTKTLSASDKALSITLKVVVRPEFSLEYDAGGTHHIENSVDDYNNPDGIAQAVPSGFTIESNASLADNLKWEVYDFSTGKKLSAGTSAKMTYSVSSISGNVTFSNVKAGTYEIYAFADEKYNTGTNAPYAYMKIVVPINLDDINIIMAVGDTYSIIQNSNIPSAGIFKYDYAVGSNMNVASVDANTSIITASRKGNVKILLTYQSANNLYDPYTTVNVIEINVTVIDGLSLSVTSANLYTRGTLMLQAMVTDPTIPITWTTSDASIATVENGLVTGIKAGAAIITAKQTINGVVKKATCQITVQQSVSNIVVDPATATLPIGGFTTLHATITPSNLSGVNLRWKSSNEGVVRVVEASALTATIEGIAGGTAVISAINQDNVVVGYCHISVRQPVTSIVLSETDVTVDMNTKRLQLRAAVYPENALNKAVTWTSTDATKARVDANGTITFLKPGTVTIIATSVDNPSVQAMCNISINIPVVSITLDATTKTMYVGQSERLSYIILPTNASTNTVVWSSTNASVVAVDNTGKIAAKGVGTAVIMLKTLDGGYTAYCTITVKRVATTVKFDVSELKLKTNEYYYIKTTLSPKDSTDNDLVWESSDTKVAVVDDAGKVIAKSAGTAIIMARTEAGGIAYCKVTVTQQATGLILNFTEKTIYIGNTFKLKASVSPSSATQLGVTWKSSNPKIATVSSDGEVNGLVGGTTLITCSTVDGGFLATCIITVRESVTTIALNHETYGLGIKKSFRLVATVSTETATNQKVVWTSSNSKIAAVNSKGKVTGISIGYAIITATSTDGSDVEASCEVRIVTPVDSITLDKAYLSMLVGDGKKLKATIRPKNSTYKTAKWSSSDETVALVDEDGMVTALKAGSATIIAEAKDNSGKKAICYIAVRDRTPSTGVTVMDKKIVMVPGEEKIVQVVLTPAMSTDGFTWSTDNAAIAKVDKKTGKITARSTGTANITIMTDSGKTAIVEVTVIGLNITELVLEQYTTYPYLLEVEGATGTVRWSIDNPLIADVTGGRVSSRAVGSAKITATVNGRKLICKLKVVKIGN